MNASDILTSALRTQGHKITKVRTLILTFLSTQEKPISAEEILLHIENEHVDLGKIPNKTPIYRELFFLLENNLICEVEFGDGKKRYELVLNRPHHHHAICRTCKRVEDIPLSSEFESEKYTMEEKTGFKIESHMLEFFGLCSNCK